MHKQASGHWDYAMGLGLKWKGTLKGHSWAWAALNNLGPTKKTIPMNALLSPPSLSFPSLLRRRVLCRVRRERLARHWQVRPHPFHHRWATRAHGGDVATLPAVALHSMVGCRDRHAAAALTNAIDSAVLASRPKCPYPRIDLWTQCGWDKQAQHIHPSSNPNGNPTIYKNRDHEW